MAAIAAAKAEAAASRAKAEAASARAAEERRKLEAAEARTAVIMKEMGAAVTSAMAETVSGLPLTLTLLAQGTYINLWAEKEKPQVARCRDVLRALCSETGAVNTDLDAAMAAVVDAGLAAQALELARVPQKDRIESGMDAPSVQRLMNAYLAAVVRAVLPDASWALGAELTTALRTDDGEVHGLYARAGGALLPHPERHANVVTTQLSAAYTRSCDGWSDKGPIAGQQQAAIRLAHRLLVKYFELHPQPAALPAERLAAYSLVADGYQLYVVCVEVAYDARRMPRLVCSQHGPLPLWGKALMDYEAGRREGVPALSRCYRTHAPGLVALVKLLRAGRAVLGDVAVTVPADLAFTIPLPPPREWIHLGSGGASETYSTMAAGGRFVVVKVARQPSVSWQPLAVEEAAYAALGAHGACAAIPALAGTATAPDGKGIAALVLSAGGDDGSGETVPVEEALAAAGDVVVTALAVVWSAVVALHHAHRARVVHRDVRGANTVWKVGAAELPTGSEVAAAIAAAEAAASVSGGSSVVEAALRLLPPPPAQLVDWGVATVHPVLTATTEDTATATASATATATDTDTTTTTATDTDTDTDTHTDTDTDTDTTTPADVFSHGVGVDVGRLHKRLLPALLDADEGTVAELAARLRGPPAKVESYVSDLVGASTAVEAALPVLRLLHLTLTHGAASAAGARHRR